MRGCGLRRHSTLPFEAEKSPGVEQARRVMSQTGVDGVLIGRAALGAPWLPGDIAEALASGRPPRIRSTVEVLRIVGRHVVHMHDFYGEDQGVRIARKHVKAYLQRLGIDAAQIRAFNSCATQNGQHDWIAALESAELHLRAA